VVDVLFKKLNDLVDKKDHAGALKAAQEGLVKLKAELATRTDEMRSLHDPNVKLDLGEGEQRLKELAVRRDELQRFADNLDNVIKPSKEPERLEMLALVEPAQWRAREAKFTGAMAR